MYTDDFHYSLNLIVFVLGSARPRAKVGVQCAVWCSSVSALFLRSACTDIPR
jgi:hypothetical protein